MLGFHENRLDFTNFAIIVIYRISRKKIGFHESSIGMANFDRISRKLLEFHENS